MKSNIKIDTFTFLTIFIILYPILPSYFYIGRFSANLILIIGSLFLVVFRKVINFKISENVKIIQLVMSFWIGVTALLQFSHREYVTAIVQLVLWLLFFPIVSNIINSKKRFLAVIDILIVTAFIVGCFSILEEITHFNIFSLLNTTEVTLNYNALRFGLLRIISFTSHAISYCCYCMIILALIFYRITIKETKRKKSYFLMYFVVLINAFLTLSRISLICLLASQMLLLWMCGYKKMLKRVLEITAILVFLILFGCLISEKFQNMVRLSMVTILVLFDDSYVSYLKNAGLVDNTRGLGNRMDLYHWVWQKLAPNYAFGKGQNTPFTYSFTNADGYSVLKQSIEVQYLRTLYRYGLVGMILEIIFYLVTLKEALKKRFKRAQYWEGTISFTRVFFSILFCYLLAFLGVMQNEELHLFQIVFVLLLAYMSHDGYNSQE